MKSCYNAEIIIIKNLDPYYLNLNNDWSSGLDGLQSAVHLKKYEEVCFYFYKTNRLY